MWRGCLLLSLVASLHHEHAPYPRLPHLSRSRRTALPMRLASDRRGRGGSGCVDLGSWLRSRWVGERSEPDQGLCNFDQTVLSRHFRTWSRRVARKIRRFAHRLTPAEATGAVVLGRTHHLREMPDLWRRNESAPVRCTARQGKDVVP